ncbi:NRAMP family divalent metal transporter [Deinococcus sp. Marseille-Q6407]|uniref:NRAMP family divalent metal transporter n=1 Tax=Deinococcus sp. Marseille-Q6407 TaxID=2969223 RepID=UPI0021C027D9|nr:NRAMP family divalent metal transporter [Deinococcus sp. Marseille-Q6407]
MTTPKSKEHNWSVLLGAAFLMATSAIGPGFLTQTSVFTQQLLASFGFVILVSIIIDLIVQTNIWRIIAVTGRRTQDTANAVLPGLGTLLAALIVIGGLAFNIGNVGGAGLGLNVVTGLSPVLSAVLSAAFAIGIFLYKEAGQAMDRLAQLLGGVMILLTLYVMFTSHPPYAEAALRTFAPLKFDLFAIITLVGGTVGGYITFAGGHRLLDAGIKGVEALPSVNRGATSAILIASLMRILLFLAALGVVSAGATLDPANPAASVFQIAAGEVGYRIFGVVMWAAAITSVVGSAYTSVSFIRSPHPTIERYHTGITVAFILLSTAVFAAVGRPVTILLAVGALNALILPVALGTMLVAAQRRNLVGNYRHPAWMTWSGWLVVVAMTVLSVRTILTTLPQLFS